jgi:hypothetical protein
VGVAMKHVRDPLPDLQLVRPEASAALSAVIDRATAKECRNRYGSVDDMVWDLEQALAIEAARAGEATGEATTVLRALPDETADFAPGRLRSPGRYVVVALLAVAGVAVAALLLATSPGPKKHRPVVVKRTAALVAVPLKAAHDYDPFGNDRMEHPTDVNKAIDRDPASFWATETYATGQLQKKGVGLYVDAGAPVAARRLDLRTPQGGFLAQIYGSRTGEPTGAGPDSFTDWGRPLASVTVGTRKRITLGTAGRQFRYYLIWIFKLPPGQSQAEIASVRLLR